MTQQENPEKYIWLTYIGVGMLLFGLGSGSVIFYDLEQTKADLYSSQTSYIIETSPNVYNIHSSVFGNFTGNINIPTRLQIGECYKVIIDIPIHGQQLSLKYSNSTMNNCS